MPQLRHRAGYTAAKLLSDTQLLKLTRIAAPYVFYFFIDDRLYSAILRSLEQTHCARMWFYMSD